MYSPLSALVEIKNELSLMPFAQQFIQAYKQVAHRETCFAVHLQGELGAGKTTLIRALLRILGYSGPVKSPTYGLIEAYEELDYTVMHLDLYRIEHLADLDHLGLRDYPIQDAEKPQLWLIEWPKIHPDLPALDLTLEISSPTETATLHPSTKRLFHLSSNSTQGWHFMNALRY